MSASPWKSVSPESASRDHDTKPRKYAAAGIPHFWRVEMADSNAQPVVRVYGIDPLSKTYALTGIHHDRLKVSSPYAIDVDISLDALKQL